MRGEPSEIGAQVGSGLVVPSSHEFGDLRERLRLEEHRSNSGLVPASIKKPLDASGGAVGPGGHPCGRAPDVLEQGVVEPSMELGEEFGAIVEVNVERSLCVARSVGDRSDGEALDALITGDGCCSTEKLESSRMISAGARTRTSPLRRHGSLTPFHG